MVVILGFALNHGVGQKLLPELATRTAKCRVEASAVRLLTISIIALAWPVIAPTIARFTRTAPEHISAIRWRVFGWALVIEISIGQNLLGSVLG